MGVKRPESLIIFAYLDHLNKGDIECKVRQVVEYQAACEHESDRDYDSEKFLVTRPERFSGVDCAGESSDRLRRCHGAHAVPKGERCGWREMRGRIDLMGG